MSMKFMEDEAEEPVLNRKRVKDYEEEFKNLIADNVWKYIDSAGIYVDKVTERELDEAVIDSARDLADLLDRKTRSIEQLVETLDLFNRRLSSIADELTVIKSKLEKATVATENTLKKDLSEATARINETLTSLKAAIAKVDEMVKKKDTYVEEQENEMERMSEEASNEILTQFGFK